MNYYEGQLLTETRQRDALRRQQGKQFANAAIKENQAKRGFFGHIMSVLALETYNLCCFDVE